MSNHDKKSTDTAPTDAANPDAGDGQLQPDELDGVVGGVAQVGLNFAPKLQQGGVKIGSQWKVEEGEK